MVGELAEEVDEDAAFADAEDGGGGEGGLEGFLEGGEAGVVGEVGEEGFEGELFDFGAGGGWGVGGEGGAGVGKAPANAISDWKGTVEPTVDATKHVNGGCRSLASDGREWECYLGQAAVDQQIVSAGFLGQEVTGPGVG